MVLSLVITIRIFITDVIKDCRIAGPGSVKYAGTIRSCIGTD